MLNAYYRKDRQSWTYRFTFPVKDGLPYTKSGFPTRKTALEAGREHVNALELGLSAKKGEHIPTVTDLWGLYDRHCRGRGQTPEWCYSKEKSFKRHFVTLLDQPAMAVTARQLQDGVNDAKAVGAHMKGQLVKIAKGFFGWALRSGHIASDPSVRLEKPQGHEEHPTAWKARVFPSEDDIAAVSVLATTDERDQLLIGRHTGSEPASLARLVWRDVDFESHELRISRKKNRSASLKYHTVPLSHAAVECLRRRFGAGRDPSEKVFRSIITDMRWKILLQKASAAAGREINFGRAVFKHMFRTAVANEPDLTPVQIQAITGCSWETLSEHYIKVDNRSAHEVIRRIFNSRDNVEPPRRAKPTYVDTSETGRRGRDKVNERAPRYRRSIRRAA